MTRRCAASSLPASLAAIVRVGAEQRLALREIGPVVRQQRQAGVVARAQLVGVEHAVQVADRRPGARQAVRKLLERQHGVLEGRVAAGTRASRPRRGCAAAARGSWARRRRRVMRSKAGSVVPLRFGVVISFPGRCQHGFGIGAHAAPQGERFGGLFDEHAPAFMGSRATLFNGPAHERRGGFAVAHVVADRVARDDAALDVRHRAREPGGGRVDHEVEGFVADILETAAAHRRRDPRTARPDSPRDPACGWR